MYAQKVAAYTPLDATAFDNHGQALNQAQAAIRAVRDPNGLGVDLGIPKDVNDVVANLTQNPVVSGRNLQQASSALRATGDWTGHRFADAIDSHLDTAPPMPGYGQVGEAGAAKNAGDLINGRINDSRAAGQGVAERRALADAGRCAGDQGVARPWLPGTRRHLCAAAVHAAIIQLVARPTYRGPFARGRPRCG